MAHHTFGGFSIDRVSVAVVPWACWYQSVGSYHRSLDFYGNRHYFQDFCRIVIGVEMAIQRGWNYLEGRLGHIQIQDSKYEEEKKGLVPHHFTSFKMNHFEMKIGSLKTPDPRTNTFFSLL